jgi:hypothetical protein
MKQFFALILLISIAACSKNKTCYKCIAVSGTTNYDKKVCTDGDPKSKLPASDANGTIGWTCTEQ